MVSKVRNVRFDVFSGGGCHHPNGLSRFRIPNFNLLYRLFPRRLNLNLFFGDTRDLIEQLPVEKRLILFFSQMVPKCPILIIILIFAWVTQALLLRTRSEGNVESPANS